MFTQSNIRILAICGIAIILFSNISIYTSNASDIENPCSGAYVDGLVYQVIGIDNARVLSLQEGQVDAILTPVDATHVDSLEADPDTDVHSIMESGYGLISFNCRRYPLNISAFRRAFALAFDKNRFVSEVSNNRAIVHDSVIPTVSSWCIEDTLPWKYYSNQSDEANQILDDLGFEVNNSTGYREFPNGTRIEISVLHSTLDAQIALETLTSLHIWRHDIITEFNVMLTLIEQTNYDMVFYRRSAPPNEPDLIFRSYLSVHANTVWNPSGYENSTFDLLFDEMKNAPTYEDAFEVISSMQKHLHENVPILIVYEDIRYQAYRTSDFTGHVEDRYLGINGPWTNVKVHNKIGNPFGGVYTIAISEEINSFNIFIQDSAVTENLFSSLYKKGPDALAYPDLAEDVQVQTHDTNLAVPEGQTWITIDVRDDAVWSDGTPLDAGDVAFTFTYINESGAYGNPASIVSWVDDFLSSEVLSPYRARLVLSRNSYLLIQQILETKIIPEHIFNDETGIGYAGWMDWNPVKSSDPFVTCGPFYLSSFTPITIRLSRNFDYHWLSGLAPKILSSNNVTYPQGSTGNQILWEVTDEDPLNYTIYRNGNLVKTDDWDGLNIVHNVDGLSAGVYNYTLVLTDASRHRVVNVVWVTVIQSMPDLLVVGTIIGSASVIIICSYLVFKRRQ